MKQFYQFEAKIRWIFLSILFAYLSVGTGVFAQPTYCTEPGSYQFVSAQNGPWLSGSTWVGGISPGNPENLTNKTILVTHNVVFGKMNMKGNVTIVVKNGATLSNSNNGETLMEGTGNKLIVKNAKLDLTGTSSNFGVKSSGNTVCAINACIWIGQNWQNDGGDIYLSNVGVRVGVNTSGNFQNNGGSITGDNLRVWLPNGDLQRNSGTWPGAMITRYKVSGNVQGFSGITVNEETSTTAIQNYTSESCTTSPVPVTLMSFDAKVNGHSVWLSWITALEANNKGFYIESSTDGKSWNNIGFLSSLAPNGNSSEQLCYNYKDAMPLKGANFYRLKQTDFDGKYEYSPVRILNFSDGSKFGIYPNPAQDYLAVSDLTGRESIVIYDFNGKALKSYSNPDSTQTINIADLNEGIYLLCIKDSMGAISTYKFIKSK